MKDRFPRLGLGRVCCLLGVTRQALYQYCWHVEEISVGEEIILKEVLEIRKDHRRMGGRKIYELLEPIMIEHQVKMGRDALFDLLARNNLLVRKKKRRVYTTQSSHWLRTYPNLAKGFTPGAPNELWVADITYLKPNYISFITDAYSHKIVGFHVADNLQGIETLQALEMAVCGLDKTKPLKLIHHSDRGVQYCWKEYVKTLKEHKIEISMTQNSDPLDNPVAERLNGIVKQEYLFDCEGMSLNTLRQNLERSVGLYNNKRPHLSLGMLSPEKVHTGEKMKLTKLWKGRKAKVISTTPPEPF
jgi:putative transposase